MTSLLRLAKNPTPVDLLLYCLGSCDALGGRQQRFVLEFPGDVFLLGEHGCLICGCAFGYHWLGASSQGRIRGW